MSRQVSPSWVMTQARASAQLDDFGDDGFLDGLERILQAFEATPLTPFAREEAIRNLVADLANRLRIESWYKAHPEIETQTIVGPLLVWGLPRTGTTATVGMLALDERFRFLREWEGKAPIPPPVFGADFDDPRAVAARAAGGVDPNSTQYLDPSIHLADTDGPEEDLMVLAGLNMRSMLGRYPMPDDYLDAWLADDFASTYAYHQRALKLLQSRHEPKMWLLKSPPHLFKLEAFARQYPDAKFIMTHRDPAAVIASVSSLYSALYARISEDGRIDKLWTGRRCFEFWTQGARIGLAARDRIGDHRFIDVYNKDLIVDPIATFERIYDELGFDLTAAFRARIERYHSRNAQGRHGEHSYTLEEFGLTRAQVRAAFRDYVDRFDL